MRYKLIISYDGTKYCGWQVQKNGKSIQSQVQSALEQFLRHPLDLTGSGRTDAGVHATGQTAHFDTEKTFTPKRLVMSLNALLPKEIRVMQIDPVEPDFHARYSAKRKIYHYHIHLDAIADPFTNLYSHKVFSSFDLDRLKRGALKFIGTHDFTSFANVKKDPNPDTTRTLYRLDVVPENKGIRLEFEGNGFLYKMVRNITGTLIDIAHGKIDPEEIPKIFAACSRKKAGQTAPAKGLFLVRVVY